MAFYFDQGKRAQMGQGDLDRVHQGIRRPKPGRESPPPPPPESSDCGGLWCSHPMPHFLVPSFPKGPLTSLCLSSPGGAGQLPSSADEEGSEFARLGARRLWWQDKDWGAEPMLATRLQQPHPVPTCLKLSERTAYISCGKEIFHS